MQNNDQILNALLMQSEAVKAAVSEIASQAASRILIDSNDMFNYVVLPYGYDKENDPDCLIDGKLSDPYHHNSALSISTIEEATSLCNLICSEIIREYPEFTYHPPMDTGLAIGAAVGMGMSGAPLDADVLVSANPSLADISADPFFRDILINRMISGATNGLCLDFDADDNAISSRGQGQRNGLAPKA